MTPQVKPSAREARRLQTRERILRAAIAEFKGPGMSGADVGAIVAAADVAHGFSSTFPARNMCSSSWKVGRRRVWQRNSRASGRRTRPVRRIDRGCRTGGGPRAAAGAGPLQRATGAALLADAAP